MAQLIINTPTDGDAVWLWELCKKLGYGMETVRFGANAPISNDNTHQPKKEVFCTKGCGKTICHHCQLKATDNPIRKESSRIIKKITKL